MSQAALVEGGPLSRADATALTRRSILAAAGELFTSRGFDAVSLRDIASVAGLSHPGLLKHFASKDALLNAVVDEMERGRRDTVVDLPLDLDTFPAIALGNARIPGYVRLFTTLAGEATRTDHPAHERFRERHNMLRTASSSIFEQSIAARELSPDTDAIGESIRLAAVWDGLQLLSLYLPERIDVPAMLQVHLDRLRGRGGPRPAPTVERRVPTELSRILPDEGGYATGRRRRARIVADATALFAQGGFHATSLREIAERVGIGKSTLLHHFGSKDELLAAVLAHRDAAMVDDSTEAVGSALVHLLTSAERARSDARTQPGLIEVYAVLSAEAAAPSHPAHEYFRNRFANGIDYFGDLFAQAIADGDLLPDLDPEFEAAWLVALWDGLQFQWLYDRETIDVADELMGHYKQLIA